MGAQRPRITYEFQSQQLRLKGHIHSGGRFMNLRKTLIASAVALALMSAVYYPAYAQESDKATISSDDKPASQAGQKGQAKSKAAHKTAAKKQAPKPGEAAQA